jgi:diacylglycerol kinase (ATP)
MKMDKNGISPRRLLKSFGYAFRGIRLMIAQEQNAKIHVFALCCVVVAGYAFRLSAMEWVAVAIVSGNVLAAELINTSIEQLSDTVSPQYSESIKRVKDFAAGAVLVTALLSVVVGAFIFAPKIAALLFRNA